MEPTINALVLHDHDNYYECYDLNDKEDIARLASDLRNNYDLETKYTFELKNFSYKEWQEVLKRGEEMA